VVGLAYKILKNDTSNLYTDVKIKLTEIRKKSDGVVVDVINVEQKCWCSVPFLQACVVIMEEFGEYCVDGCSGFSIDQIWFLHFLPFFTNGRRRAGQGLYGNPGQTLKKI
jgi:hypothetical protein